MCTDWQQSRGKSSLYRRPVRSVVIIFTLTELMCLEPISRIRAITLVSAYMHRKQRDRINHVKGIWVFLALNDVDFMQKLCELFQLYNTFPSIIYYLFGQ